MTDRPQNYRFHQGQKTLSFTTGEYAARIAGLRRIMNDHDAAVVILTSQYNLAYYAGVIPRAFGRAYALVVTAHECVVVHPAVDGGQPSRRAHCDSIAYTDGGRSNYQHTVRSVAGIGRIVGYEADDLTVLQTQSLRHHLHPTGLVDVSIDTMCQRTDKSDAERALIAEGAAVAAVGIAAMRDAIKPDIREIDVAMAGRDAMELEIATCFPQAEFRDTWAQCQSGINADGAHNQPTSRALQSGDNLLLSAHPMISGYYAPIARTFHLGELDPAGRKTWEANVAAHAYAKSLIAPGITCGEVVTKINSFYAERDLLQYRTAGYGHALGVMSHYYGREAAVTFREDNETVLEPGMVITVEPTLAVPADQPGGGGYREQDIVFVTEDGSETVTTFGSGPDENVISA